MRLGLFERLGFQGTRRVKVQVIWTLEKESQMCSYTYTLVPHLLEEEFREVKQLIIWNCPFSAKQGKLWKWIRPEMKLAVEKGARLKWLWHFEQEGSKGASRGRESWGTPILWDSTQSWRSHQSQQKPVKATNQRKDHQATPIEKNWVYWSHCSEEELIMGCLSKTEWGSGSCRLILRKDGSLVIFATAAQP